MATNPISQLNFELTEAHGAIERLTQDVLKIDRSLNSLQRQLLLNTKDVAKFTDGITELSKATEFYSRTELVALAAQLKSSTSALSNFGSENDKFLKNLVQGVRQDGDKYLALLDKITTSFPQLTTRIKEASTSLSTMNEVFSRGGTGGVTAYLAFIGKIKEGNGELRNLDDVLNRVSAKFGNFRTAAQNAVSAPIVGLLNSGPLGKAAFDTGLAGVAGLGAVTALRKGSGYLGKLFGTGSSGTVGEGGRVSQDERSIQLLERIAKAVEGTRGAISEDAGVSRSGGNPSTPSFHERTANYAKRQLAWAGRNADYLAAGIGALGVGVSTYGQETGNAGLQTFGRGMSTIGGTTAAGFALGGPVGGAIGAGAGILQAVTNEYDDKAAGYRKEVTDYETGLDASKEYKLKFAARQAFFQNGGLGAYGSSISEAAAGAHENRAVVDEMQKKIREADSPARKAEAQQKYSIAYGVYQSSLELAPALAGAETSREQSQFDLNLQLSGRPSSRNLRTAQKQEIKTLQEQRAGFETEGATNADKLAAAALLAKENSVRVAGIGNTIKEGEAEIKNVAIQRQKYDLETKQLELRGASYDKVTQRQKEGTTFIDAEITKREQVIKHLIEEDGLNENSNIIMEKRAEITGLQVKREGDLLDITKRGLAETRMAFETGFSIADMILGDDPDLVITKLKVNVEQLQKEADSAGDATVQLQKLNEVKQVQAKLDLSIAQRPLKTGQQELEQYKALSQIAGANGPEARSVALKKELELAEKLKKVIQEQIASKEISGVKGEFKLQELENSAQRLRLEKQFNDELDKPLAPLQRQQELLDGQLNLLQQMRIPAAAVQGIYHDTLDVLVKQKNQLESNIRSVEANETLRAEQKIDMVQKLKKEVLSVQSQIAGKLDFSRRSLAEQFTETTFGQASGTYANPMALSSFATLGSGYFTGISALGRGNRPGSYGSQLRREFGEGVSERNWFQQTFNLLKDGVMKVEIVKGKPEGVVAPQLAH